MLAKAATDRRDLNHQSTKPLYRPPFEVGLERPSNRAHAAWITQEAIVEWNRCEPTDQRLVVEVDKNINEFFDSTNGIMPDTYGVGSLVIGQGG